MKNPCFIWLPVMASVSNRLEADQTDENANNVLARFNTEF